MGGKSFLFPGQGAQAVGMGRDLAETYASAGEVFDMANRETGLPLDKLCFQGPLHELSRSDIAQPAILTVSIALLRALAEAAGMPVQASAAAGLSLGEYSALVAAGALDFQEAVRLVQHRGVYMQEACDASPGAMYSIIGLEDAQVEQACETARGKTGGGVWPANYNCPGQVVISGDEGPALEAAEACIALGARRAIRLNVAGAFHTPLMQPAAEKLRAELAKAHIRKPAYPVVANVTGRPTGDPNEIRGLLVRQITSPVRWLDSMRWLIGQGIAEYYEVGPGRILQGLLKRTDPSMTCVSLAGAGDVRALVEAAAPRETERKVP
jgi:[acyl-carrier-protein] S-malonyltransferase